MMIKLIPKMIVHVVAMVHESLAKPDALVLTGKLNWNNLVVNLRFSLDLDLPDKLPLLLISSY